MSRVNTELYRSGMAGTGSQTQH